jgi:hypothetical protein
MPAVADVYRGEIVFNELLPEPFTGGSEYIELYNRSHRSLSLAGLAICTRKADGTLNAYSALSSITHTLDEGGYALLTKDKEGVASWYLLSAPEAVHEVKLPILANTSSTLVLLRLKDLSVIDEISYTSQWHSSFVKDKKGVALERIHPDEKTQDAGNWTSAAALSGYGTPGYRNSQQGTGEGANVTSISAPVRKEDGFWHIAWQAESPGYNCRAFLYNLSGNRVAEISNNELLGTSGEWLWDGRGSTGNFQPTGIYILFTELYKPDGTRLQFKQVILIKNP